MSEQMLKMKLQHLTHMGNRETCTVSTVYSIYSTYRSKVRTVMSQNRSCFKTGLDQLSAV